MFSQFGPKSDNMIPEPLGMITEPLPIYSERLMTTPVIVSSDLANKQTHKHTP